MNMMVLVVAGLILFVISTIGMIVIYTIELHNLIVQVEHVIDSLLDMTQEIIDITNEYERNLK